MSLLLSMTSQAMESIDFHQALQRLLDRSPQYQNLTLIEKNATLAMKNAWNSLLPTVDLQANHVYNQMGGNDYLNLAPLHYPWSNQAGLIITENLYDNGDTWRQARIASLVQHVEALNLESGRSRLLTNAAKAYFDFSSAYGSMQLQKQQIDVLRNQFHMIERRYQQGLRSNRDYLRIKAQLQNSELGLMSQQISLENSKTSLRAALGESPSTDFIPIDAVRIDFGKIDYPTLDPEQTYEYQVADLQDQISGIRYESVHRKEWPRLTLKGSYGYVVPQYLGPHTSGVDDPYWNFQAMIVLDYRLWDWLRTQRTVDIAENQKNIERNNQQLNRLQVQQNLDLLQKQSSTLRQSFQLSGQLLKSNEAAYQSLNAGYLDGKVTYLELITALNDLYSSRTQDLNIRFNILKFRTEQAHAQRKIDEVLKNL